MGCIPTWDCDVFSSRGHNVSDLDTTGSRKVGAPTFLAQGVGLGITSDLSGWGPLDKVLKRMDFGFILDLSAIMVLCY